MNVKVNKVFRGVEKFMAPSGYMMQRDVFDVLLTEDEPGKDGEIIKAGTKVANSYGKSIPIGQMTGKSNRKSRRVAMSKGKKK